MKKSPCFLSFLEMKRNIHPDNTSGTESAHNTTELYKAWKKKKETIPRKMSITPPLRVCEYEKNATKRRMTHGRRLMISFVLSRDSIANQNQNIETANAKILAIIFAICIFYTFL